MFKSGLLKDGDTTSEDFFRRRQSLLSVGSAFVLGGAAFTSTTSAFSQALVCGTAKIPEVDEKPTPSAEATGYNNYYEFSTDKKAVKTLAQALTVSPWTLTVEGEVEKPYTLDLSEMLKLMGPEERIYRFRCVEAWSMVVPWSGFSLCKLIARANPSSRAKFVEFVSLKRSGEMIGQRGGSGIDWPYREGLRIDEAMHPLTMLVTGAYGEPLAKQNGGPMRVVVPWKYGFKSPKAITHIRLMSEQPQTSWNKLAPSEYGFFGNVNPNVNHPRWSQSREVRLGEVRKRATLPFNGYADQVAHLYSGSDPKTMF